MIPFRTVSGRRVDLERPRPEDVDVRDIACGLSKICRFTGQLRRFYSVAQHSSFVARIVPPELRRAALFHDASEAYLNDLTRYLKHSEYLAGYRLLEDRWREAISAATRTIVSPEQAIVLKAADDLAAVWERVVLRNEGDWDLDGLVEIERVVAEGWVRTDVETLRGFGRLVPPWWTPLNCSPAEAQFLTDAGEFR